MLAGCPRTDGRRREIPAEETDEARMSIAVGLGLADFPFSSAAAYWRWVAQCEEGGVDALWQTDRLISRHPVLECMSTMAALAGATQRLKFGMNVASVALRDPVLLAKQCATIDMLSGGRLLPAFGIGSVRGSDWQATGRNTRARGKRTNEGLEIIRRLWSGEAVDFDGEFHQLRGATISPLPVQKNLPLWLGGSSDAAVRRTGRCGTGWQGAFETPEEMAVIISAIRRAAAAAGRRIPEDHYGAAFAFRYGSWDDEPVARSARAYRERLGRDPARIFVCGGSAEIMERIEEYAAAGVSKFILRPVGADDADMAAQTRSLITEVLPAVAALNRRAA